MDQAQVLADPCPACGVLGKIDVKHRQELVKVKGEHFAVAAEFFHCAHCGVEFDVAGTQDSLAVAFAMYRKRHGLVTPEELRKWRLHLELKQTELASILGWSTATVSRYENGALQDDAHDRAMKAAMTPEGLLAIVDATEGISDVVRERLRAKANAEVGGAPSLLRVLTSRFASKMHEVAFDYRKTTELVLYFCHMSAAGVPRTKLNKLLWYADFLHVKHFGSTVTGMPYVRLQFGPVPESYELLFMALQSEKVLDIRTEEYDEGWIAHFHCALRSPELNAFTPTELQALAKVQTELGNLTAKAIAERSHEEQGWQQTNQGDVIGPHFAKALSLSL